MHRGLRLAVAVAFVSGVASVVVFSRALPAPEAAPPSEPPGVFLARVVGLIVADRYEEAWPTLYPKHQQVAPREEYVACERRSPVGWQLRSARVLRVSERLAALPGVDGPVRQAAVTLRLRIFNPALHAEGAFTHTFHAVADGSRWTWVLTPSRYALYKSDEC